MKNFNGLVLCNYRSDRVEVHVRASIEASALTVEGQDLGAAVEQFWGDSDYEYWYSFDAENTAKLLSVIRGEQDPESALLREFSGESGCRALREVCRKNGIQYRFDSYV